MPPVQCPDCGRFLKRDFVASLGATPSPCPRCGAGLVSEMFEAVPELARTPTLAADVEVATVAVDADAVDADAVDADAVDADAGEDDAGDAAAGDDEPDSGAGVHEPTPSVRPPDLAPDAVRRYDDDVLHGWDVGVEQADLAPHDRPPFPADTVWLGVGAAGGAALALAVARWRGSGPVSGAVFGGLAGAVAVAVGRQVWRLEA